MKKANTVSKHDILRELKGINEKLYYLYDHLNSVNRGVVEYIAWKGDEQKFVTHMEKKDAKPPKQRPQKVKSNGDGTEEKVI